MDNDKNQALTKIQQTLINSPSTFKIAGEIGSSAGLFWDSYYTNLELHIPETIDIGDYIGTQRDGYHIISRKYNPDLYHTIKNFGEYQENALNTYYQGVIKTVQVEVEKIQEDLELERKSKLNLQKNSTLLEDEILKEKSTRSNLEKEFVDIRTRFEKLYQSKNNLENLHQQKVEEFRTKFKIVEGLADNQTDLGMQLKITQLDLFSTGCKLMKKEQEYQELQTLLENEKAALRLMISKYELDLQSKQNELTFAKDNINEHLLRITHLNNEIQRLNNDKNEMFDEYDRLKNEAEKELQKLRSKCESLKREKNLLIRGQKIGLISKGIKWTTYWFMDPQKHKLLEVSLDTGEVYTSLHNLDAWSYEIAFLGLGFLASYIISKFFKKKVDKNPTIIIQ